MMQLALALASARQKVAGRRTPQAFHSRVRQPVSIFGCGASGD
jgi:hypothetical protein